MKKKQDGGLKKIFIFFLFLIFTVKNLYGTQILDYETEQFINKIIEDIIEVNNINKNIKFKINNSNEINAFVDLNNTIHINSGLIIHCSDYVALLSVLAHEIGHIELNHIKLRKKTLDSNKNYNNLGLLSIIASSALTQNPKILQGSLVTSAALSRNYILFTKDQEMEADLYALKTLNFLDTNSKSIIKLLETIEKKSLNKGFSKDNQRVSTHPYFEDRIILIKNFNHDKKNNNLDINYNKRFNFIKAKFIGYNDDEDVLKNLNEPYKSYAKSIKKARNGNLKMSLEILNEIIKKNENSFLLETKADILFSHGYTKEAVKFYKKNLEEFPLNYYAKIRIFENLDIDNLTSIEINTYFQKNMDLLYNYFNNKNVLLKYIELAEILNEKEWLQCFKLILSINDIEKNVFANELQNLKKTKNEELLKLISVIQNIS